jgi:two-component system phosphate regulon sensor histidine kinase PhoR
MASPLRKITFVFILIAIVPVIFLLYEIGDLSRNEAIVREAYRNQLESILYSVNQYTDDVVNSWANQIRTDLKSNNPPDDSLKDRMRSILNQTQIARYVYLTDLKGHSVLIQMNEEKIPTAKVKATIDSMVNASGQVTEKLIEYEKAGFRKLEPFNVTVTRDCVPILFAVNSKRYAIGALVVDLRRFIRGNLASKMQEISQEKMTISAFSTLTDSLVYSTDPLLMRPESEEYRLRPKPVIMKKDFWVLPGYHLGIALNGTTIDDLVGDRKFTSVTIIILLFVVLAIGIIFLYRNIRRELYLSQAKSEFVSNVSHEIRTPLSLIGMFAETLETGRVTSEEKKQEYYSIINKETARLSRIVNRILNFSQLEANKKRFHFERLDLNDVCAATLRLYFVHMEDKGFRFEYLPEGDLALVEGDRESIAEALVNLVDNAMKYSADRKHIIVRTSSDQKFAFIEVQDEGIGIARQHHKYIFDQFFRAPSGDIHTTKGSGLGLTLVRKIMEAHHGDVQVESSPGKGSTFRLRFPLKQKANELQDPDR